MLEKVVVASDSFKGSLTSTGKLPYAVARRAKDKGVPVIAFCGTAQIPTNPFFSQICPVTPVDMPLEEAMRPSVASSNLIQTVRSVIQDYMSAL